MHTFIASLVKIDRCVSVVKGVPICSPLYKLISHTILIINIGALPLAQLIILYLVILFLSHLLVFMRIQINNTYAINLISCTFPN